MSTPTKKPRNASLALAAILTVAVGLGACSSDGEADLTSPGVPGGMGGTGNVGGSSGAGATAGDASVDGPGLLPTRRALRGLLRIWNLDGRL